jgi:hypothetical protein
MILIRRSNPYARIAAAACGLWLCAAAASAAAGQSRVELRDGSVLQGELVSVEASSYRIRTGALGEISIPESDVLAIRPLGSNDSIPAAPAIGTTGAASATPQAMRGDLASIQQQLASDPAILGAIMSLQQDPEIRAALANPGFAQLVLSGNVQAIQNDPRFQRLLQNPAIQSIVKQVAGQ